MADLNPRIHRLPAPTPAAQHGDARGGAVPQEQERREASAPGHGDSAVLSAAGRAALDRDDAPDLALTAEQALATATSAAESSVSIAGAAHTRAIMRAARLLR